jgi:hypothetical protein
LKRRANPACGSRGAAHSRILVAVRALLFGLVATAFAPGCRDGEVDQLLHVRDRACACHDTACADAALADVPAHDVHATPRAQGIANEIFRCVARVREEKPDVGSGSAGAEDSGSGSGT